MDDRKCLSWGGGVSGVPFLSVLGAVQGKISLSVPRVKAKISLSVPGVKGKMSLSVPGVKGKNICPRGKGHCLSQG